jgi:hypothetical protein
MQGLVQHVGWVYTNMLDSLEAFTPSVLCLCVQLTKAAWVLWPLEQWVLFSGWLVLSKVQGARALTCLINICLAKTVAEHLKRRPCVVRGEDYASSM